MWAVRAPGIKMRWFGTYALHNRVFALVTSLFPGESARRSLTGCPANSTPKSADGRLTFSIPKVATSVAASCFASCVGCAIASGRDRALWNVLPGSRRPIPVDRHGRGVSSMLGVARSDGAFRVEPRATAIEGANSVFSIEQTE